MPLDPTKVTDLTIHDAETLTRVWSIASSGVAVDPTAISIKAQKGTKIVTWTTGGSGVVDNDDGTIDWTITAGDLTPGKWTWWANVTWATGGPETPDNMHGTITVEDRS